MLNCRITFVASGMVTSLAGSTSGYLDGVGSNAKFSYLQDITCFSSGTNGPVTLFLADTSNKRIRSVDATTGTILLCMLVSL